MNQKRDQKLSIFKAMRHTIPMVIRVIPFTALLYAFIAVLHGSAFGLVAPINQRLYDALANVAIGQGYLRYVYIAAAMVTGTMLVQQILNAVHNFVGSNIMGQKASGRIHDILHRKIQLHPAHTFEDKERLDDIEKAGSGASSAVYMYGTSSDILFFYGAYFVVMGAFLWNMQPILLLALLLVFVPVILGQIIEAKLFANLEEETAPIRRKYGHYLDCMVAKDKMKETRIFGAYYFFKRLYFDTFNLLLQKQWTVHKKNCALSLLLNIVKAIGWVGILALLFRSLVQSNISVGAFAAVFGSVGMMFSLTEEIFNRLKYDFAQNLGKIHNFINVLEVQVEAKGTTEPDFPQGIHAVGLTFAYPKAEKNAVDGVSISLRHGEKLALVGENGSGKTTLVKLLSGLYKPSGGTVTIGGCDSTQTTDKALFARMSGVFQNYARYAINLGDNVRIGAFASGNDPIPAMELADVDHKDARTFPQGLETILDRAFDGVELSGGQWQRIAMARGLYRHHDFIILDEPTAAIDPLEETRIYEKFAELARNKMAILVTHRLGSARIADRIAVMDGGKIVEIGTHESLLAKKGKYAEMWVAQAEGYG